VKAAEPEVAATEPDGEPTPLRKLSSETLGSTNVIPEVLQSLKIESLAVVPCKGIKTSPERFDLLATESQVFQFVGPPDLLAAAQQAGVGGTTKLTAISTVLSPIALVNLPPAVREVANIPKNATHFAFVYPAPGAKAQEAQACSPELSLLLYGGYAYFDENKFANLLVLNSIAGPGVGLTFDGPYRLHAKAQQALVKQARLHPTTLIPIMDAGAKSFGWVNPDENGSEWLGDVPAEYGAFAYCSDRLGKEQGVFFRVVAAWVPQVPLTLGLEGGGEQTVSLTLPLNAKLTEVLQALKLKELGLMRDPPPGSYARERLVDLEMTLEGALGDAIADTAQRGESTYLHLIQVTNTERLDVDSHPAEAFEVVVQLRSQVSEMEREILRLRTSLGALADPVATIVSKFRFELKRAVFTRSRGQLPYPTRFPFEPLYLAAASLPDDELKSLYTDLVATQSVDDLSELEGEVIDRLQMTVLASLGGERRASQSASQKMRARAILTAAKEQQFEDALKRVKLFFESMATKVGEMMDKPQRTRVEELQQAAKVNEMRATRREEEEAAKRQSVERRAAFFSSCKEAYEALHPIYEYFQLAHGIALLPTERQPTKRTTGEARRFENTMELHLLVASTQQLRETPPTLWQTFSASTLKEHERYAVCHVLVSCPVAGAKEFLKKLEQKMKEERGIFGAEPPPPLDASVLDAKVEALERRDEAASEGVSTAARVPASQEAGVPPPPPPPPAERPQLLTRLSFTDLHSADPQAALLAAIQQRGQA